MDICQLNRKVQIITLEEVSVDVDVLPPFDSIYNGVYAASPGALHSWSQGDKSLKMFTCVTYLQALILTTEYWVNEHTVKLACLVY